MEKNRYFALGADKLVDSFETMYLEGLLADESFDDGGISKDDNQYDYLKKWTIGRLEVIESLHNFPQYVKYYNLSDQNILIIKDKVVGFIHAIRIFYMYGRVNNLDSILMDKDFIRVMGKDLMIELISSNGEFDENVVTKLNNICQVLLLEDAKKFRKRLLNSFKEASEFEMLILNKGEAIDPRAKLFAEVARSPKDVHDLANSMWGYKYDCEELNSSEKQMYVRDFPKELRKELLTKFGVDDNNILLNDVDTIKKMFADYERTFRKLKKIVEKRVDQNILAMLIGTCEYKCYYGDCSEFLLNHFSFLSQNPANFRSLTDLKAYISYKAAYFNAPENERSKKYRDSVEDFSNAIYSLQKNLFKQVMDLYDRIFELDLRFERKKFADLENGLSAFKEAIAKAEQKLNIPAESLDKTFKSYEIRAKRLALDKEENIKKIRGMLSNDDLDIDSLEPSDYSTNKSAIMEFALMDYKRKLVSATLDRAACFASNEENLDLRFIDAYEPCISLRHTN